MTLGLYVLWLGSVNAVAWLKLELSGVHRVLASRMLVLFFIVVRGGPFLRKGAG